MLVKNVVRRALEEDLGRGDITSEATVFLGLQATGYLTSKSEGVLAGLKYARAAFKIIDAGLEFESYVKDGAAVKDGTQIARVYGNARSILAAERVALNFLQRLSGIATTTASAVKAARLFGTKITDTRKTTPGLRVAEKYAVRVGGGVNHRLGLDDAILIKDNHLQMAGGIRRAVRLAKQNAGHLVKIEVEVETMEQVAEAAESGADVIMLDNMTLDEMREAVRVISGQAVIEASGGITPERVAGVASTGVDVISLGWLTHSVLPLDISLDLEKTQGDRGTINGQQ